MEKKKKKRLEIGAKVLRMEMEIEMVQMVERNRWLAAWSRVGQLEDSR